ncbi:MAG: MFS transporter [Marinilabiliales bacterium]|nr:MFS transporter [Marinilabiliales bacterium]
MINFLKPPPYKEPLPEEKVDATYKRLRLQVFLGAFVGYAAYYLVRKNLALAIPGMIQPVESGGLGYTKLQLGIALSAISIAYAFSKFLMGALSDRSDARKFLVIGLVLSASLMMCVGLFPFATSSSGHHFHVHACDRMARRNGMASLRQDHGALVLAQRTKLQDGDMEHLSHRRQRPDGQPGRMGHTAHRRAFSWLTSAEVLWLNRAGGQSLSSPAPWLSCWLSSAGGP